MKVQFVASWFAAALVVYSLAASGQTTDPAVPAAPQNVPAKTREHKGKVVFSRSTDDQGQVISQAGPTAKPELVANPIADDAERQAVAYTGFDMDVHLRPDAHQIAVRASLTVRNDGKSPLARIPLQISSTLTWERIRLAGKDISFQVATLNSDSDHTGQLHEAAVPLATSLAPGASLQLDVTYSGTIAATAQRLLAIGTPGDAALHSDWDQIDTDFTGLRGFGNAVWYPVSSVPVILGDGARLFDEIGEHKLRLSGARFHVRLTIEFPHGRPPTVALINGHSAELKIMDSPSGASDVSGIATAQLDARLGCETPNLFVATRKAHPGTNLTAWTLPDNDVAVQAWINAAVDVTPFLQGWLGQRPRAELTLLDLPDPQDAPYESGAMLATNLHDGPPDQLDGILTHALTHAWIQSPRAWLSEGVAHFMGTLWVEKQQGRDKALTALEAGRQALALAEPASPGESTGQPLTRAISPAYYRTKATYVLWMLRDIVTDPVLSAALRAYNPEQDVINGSGPSSGAGYFQSLLEQAGNRHDLTWFFEDWVDADKGLPDLAVDSVFPSAEQSGNWLVAVNVSNSGFCDAEVPVTVLTAETAVTQRVRIPARTKQVQRILIQGKPTEIHVNDGTVPEIQASLHVTKVGGLVPAAAPSPSPR